MKILADENIAQVRKYFGGEGELTVMPGRAIDAQAVKEADVLLVRSVTCVDQHLLRDSPCKFVGTATSGIDHIDTKWLAGNNIGLGWAKGCNADSVVDYVFSVLACLSDNKGFDWRALSFGIVGCGEVGSRLATKLLNLQCTVHIHDPFLDASHPLASYFATYEKVIEQDVVTFHTPLTSSSLFPTWHMMAGTKLDGLTADSILINAARGAVVDNRALLAKLEKCPGLLVILDAWEGEPAISLDLLKRVIIATPHIAGYSMEGKLNGTRMVHAQFRDFFDMKVSAEPKVVSQKMMVEIDKKLPPLAQLNQLIRTAYDVMRDHAAMQELLHVSDTGLKFDSLRKSYPMRHEFSAFSVKANELSASIHDQARILGFTLVA